MAISNLIISDNSLVGHKVADRPDTSGEYSAATVKGWFDDVPINFLKPAFNSLITALISIAENTSGADVLGCAPLEGGTANTIRGVLVELKAAIDALDVEPTTYSPTIVTVTLVAASWLNNSQTVDVAGLAADSKIVVSLDSLNATENARSDARYAYLYVVTQTAGHLGFRYDGTKPTHDIPVNVMIM